MIKDFHLKELTRVLRLMGKRKWTFLISCFMASVSTAALVIVNSIMYKQAINGAIYGDFMLLRKALLLMIAALIMICIVSPVTSYLSNYFAKKTMLNIRVNTFSHVLKLPTKYFAKQGRGDVLSRLTNDLNKIGAVYEGELFQALYDITIGLGGLITVFILDWRLAIVVVVLGTITSIVNSMYAKSFRQISQRIQGRLAKLTQKFLDLFGGNSTIKLFNVESLMIDKFAKENGEIAKENINLVKKECEKESISYLMSAITSLGVLGTGAIMISSGFSDLGTVVAVFYLIPAVDDLFIKAGSSLANIQKSLAGVNRAFELMDQQKEEVPPSSYCFSRIRGDWGREIIVEDIQHSYDGEKIILDNINITFEQGKVTALVGPSGGGKSSIMKLLLALDIPTKGRIIYHSDNEDEINLYGLREKLSYVAQNSYLFDCTIEENIRYGNMEASKEEIIQAAKSANAHGFITNLSDGYDTKVGEGGVMLSGGQRQRIAIARALLKNAPILLLDEATSALDSESELLVQEAMDRLIEGRTTIVIAHRPSTIQRADKVYIVREGKVYHKDNYPKEIEITA